MILFILWQCCDQSAHTDVFKILLGPDCLCGGLIHLNTYHQKWHISFNKNFHCNWTGFIFASNRSALFSNYSLNIPNSAVTVWKFIKRSQEAALSTSHQLSRCPVVLILTYIILSFVRNWFCHMMRFRVLSEFEFLSYVTIWIFLLNWKVFFWQI